MTQQEKQINYMGPFLTMVFYAWIGSRVRQTCDNL